MHDITPAAPSRYLTTAEIGAVQDTVAPYLQRGWFSLAHQTDFNGPGELEGYDYLEIDPVAGSPFGFGFSLGRNAGGDYGVTHHHDQHGTATELEPAATACGAARRIVALVEDTLAGWGLAIIPAS